MKAMGHVPVPVLLDGRGDNHRATEIAGAQLVHAQFSHATPTSAAENTAPVEGVAEAGSGNAVDW